MRFAVLGVLVAACAVAQQQNPVSSSDVPGDTVVATLNGRKLTADDVKHMVAGAPAQVKSAFARDPKQFLRDHAYYLMLLDYAEKNALDKTSPHREAIEFYRLFVLTNAALNHKMQSIDVTPEEQKAFYEANQEQYREARVRMIYVPFGGSQPEEQAKSKAAEIAKRAREGEDFVKLAKENSEDPTGAGGDFSVRMKSSQPPEHMRKVILTAKAGDTTDPLRHDNGYYIFRVESIEVMPYEQVRNDVYRAIQDTRFREWQDQTRSKASVEFENEAFFTGLKTK